MKMRVVFVVFGFWIATGTYPNELSPKEPSIEIDGKVFVPLEMAEEIYESLSESEAENQELRVKLESVLLEREKDQENLLQMTSRVEGLLEEKRIILKSKKANPRWIEGFVGGGMLLDYSPLRVGPYAEVGARIRLKFLYDGLAIRISAGYPDSRLGLELSF